MYKLEYEATINCAHELEKTISLYSEKCLNLHGHDFRIKITIEAEKLEDGMIIDFGILKNIIYEWDHKYLNDFVDNPTAETLSFILHGKIEKELEKRNIVETKLKVQVSENPHASITYW